MARTKTELTTLSATRIREQDRKTLNWGKIISSLNRAGVPQRDVIIQAVKDGDALFIGELIINEVNSKLQSDADSEATTILADDNVDITELDRIL